MIGLVTQRALYGHHLLLSSDEGMRSLATNVSKTNKLGIFSGVVEIQLATGSMHATVLLHFEVSRGASEAISQPMQVMLVTFGLLQILGVDGEVGSLQGLQDIGQLSTLIHLAIIVGLVKVDEISHGLDELNRSGLGAVPGTGLNDAQHVDSVLDSANT